MASGTSGGDRLLEEMLEAMGGAGRIASVGSYAREAALVWAPAGRGAASAREDGASAAAGADGIEPLSLAFRAMDRSGARAARERTLRAAPGRARVEVTGVDAGVRGMPALLALAGPGARHDHGPDPEDARKRAAASIGASCPTCAGEAALREAAREPRNLLAHARERGAIARAMPDGGLEIAVPAQDLLYRFDPATLLCAGRTDVRGGASMLYDGWRYVDGIATPFVEIELGAAGRLERRVLAVAYGLAWPDRLFRVP